MNAPSTLVIFMGVLASLVCLWIAVNGAGARNRRMLGRRVESIHERAAGAPSKDGMDNAHSSIKRQDGSGGWPVLEQLAKRLVPRGSKLKDRLARSGREIPMGTYLLVNLGLAVLAFAASFAVFGLPLAMAVPISLIAGAGLPHLAVGRMAGARRNRFMEIFPDAIDLIVRGIRSGLPVGESISEVGKEMADPVGREFTLISDSVKMGQQLEFALWETARRLDMQEFNFFVISLSVQRETGGNLGETLANLSEILRQRRQMKLKIKAMSSEARASAYILGSLPFIMFGIIFMLNPDYEMDLFNDSRGRAMLGGAAIMMSLGVAVMNKMVKFEI